MKNKSNSSENIDKIMAAWVCPFLGLGFQVWFRFKAQSLELILLILTNERVLRYRTLKNYLIAS